MRGLIRKYYFIPVMLLLFGCSKPPIDWYRSYDSTDVIPYGTYILRQELENIFPDSHIENIKEKTSDFIINIPFQNNTGYYMFIHDNMERRDSLTWSLLLDYIQEGGTAFISTSKLSKEFEDKLGLRIYIDSATLRKPVPVALSVKNGKRKQYILEKGTRTGYLGEYDSENTDILGYISDDGKAEMPNFAKVYYGYGYLLIHTQPVAFTNYHMLESNHYEYVTDVFSYLSDEAIFWDNHRMMRREYGGDDGGFFSFLDFVMKHESLRWAVYLLLISGLAYLFFNSKRRQRAIPILLPYSNYTLDFAKTLSEVYRNNPDHTAMVKYKINYFLEQLRSKYHISPREMEKDFSELLSAKSGVDLQSCKDLISALDIYRRKDYSNREDFFKLQTLLDNFNKKSIQYGRTESRQ